MGFTPVNKPYKLQPNEREAIRRGGSIVHVLPLNENGGADRLALALCGDGPKEQRKRMFTRAGWWGTLEAVTCPKCLAILKAREDQSE